MAKFQRVMVVAEIVEGDVVVDTANVWSGYIPLGRGYDNGAFIRTLETALGAQASIGAAGTEGVYSQEDVETLQAIRGAAADLFASADDVPMVLADGSEIQVGGSYRMGDVTVEVQQVVQHTEWIMQGSNGWQYSMGCDGTIYMDTDDGVMGLPTQYTIADLVPVE